MRQSKHGSAYIAQRHGLHACSLLLQAVPHLPVKAWCTGDGDTAGVNCRVGGDRKVAALQNDLAALEAALTAAQQEYERVKARNLQVCVQGSWV